MLYVFIIFIALISSNIGDLKMCPQPPNNEDFLNKIEAIESSGGTNTDHPVVTNNNLQQGARAIGRYGLMPNTVKELVNRRRVRGTVSPEMLDVSRMEPEDMKSYIEGNPELEDQLAHDLVNHVIQRQGGDADKAAYSWNYGHNLTPDQITPEQLNNSDYVNKFRRLGNMVNRTVANNPIDEE